MWLPAWLPDVESDLSAMHRVDDIYQMPASRFFMLAWRLPHYRGVLRDRVLALQREHEDEPQPARSLRAQAAAAGRTRAAEPEPVTRAALNDPVLSKIFSFS